MYIRAEEPFLEDSEYEWVDDTNYYACINVITRVLWDNCYYYVFIFQICKENG